MLKRIHGSYLFVENVKESAHWYASTLNLPLEIDSPEFCLIKIGTNELCFHQADSKSPLTTGGCVTYWSVDDLLESISMFEGAGGVVYRGPIEIPENDDGICQIKDPFGNVIGLQGKYRAKP